MMKRQLYIRARTRESLDGERGVEDNVKNRDFRELDITIALMS